MPIATKKNLYLDRESMHVDDYDEPVTDQISNWMKDMKLIREYVRNILLESLSGVNPKIKRMMDFLVEKNGLINAKVDGFGGIDVHLIWYGDINNRYWTQDSGHVYASYNRGYDPGECNGARIIGGVTLSGDGTYADEEMGPLLYDILMEALISQGYTGLGPDYWYVSDDAYKLWDYYLNNRPDIVAKQRDITQFPRTTDKSDDCTDNYGYRASAKRFPGGIKSAYAGNEPGPDGENPGEQLSDEFIEYWFDPKNPLSKTYHKKSPGTPLLDYLKKNMLLHPQGAKELGMPYTQKEFESVWRATLAQKYPPNHERIPWITGIWASDSGMDTTEILKDYEQFDGIWFYKGQPTIDDFGKLGSDKSLAELKAEKGSTK